MRIPEGIYKLTFPELWWCRENIPRENLELSVVLWWRIWFNRNRIVHGHLPMNSFEMFAWARDYLDEFQRPNRKADPKQKWGVINNAQRWLPPEGNCLKLNTDAAYNGDNRKMGLGMVIRNNAGKVLMSACKGLTCGASAKIAEANAIKWGIQLAISAGLKNLWVEYDAKEVIQAINSTFPLNELGTIIQDIQTLLSHAYCLGITYIPRSTNAVADGLAKDGIDCMDCKIWMEDVSPGIKNLVESDML